MQASDFTNVGDWPTLGKGATPTTTSTPANNEPGTSAEATKKTTETTTKPGGKPNKSVETKKSETKVTVEKTSHKTVTPPKKPSANAPPKSGAAAAKSSGESSSNQNGAVSNGPSTSANNSSNRRVPKSKWVPLEIDVPKARTKGGRERNNNVNGKRRERPGENEERPRRTRASSLRSSGSTTRTSGVNGSGRVTAGSGRTSAGPGKRTGTLRTAGGIQKQRYRNQNLEFTLDYPMDLSLVKKMTANGATGVDGGTPFVMPYMGTFYYNGVPSYAKMDPSSLKEAIKKQMYAFDIITNQLTN